MERALPLVWNLGLSSENPGAEGRVQAARTVTKQWPGLTDVRPGIQKSSGAGQGLGLEALVRLGQPGKFGLRAVTGPR